jgi:hypothetical protein
MKNIFILLVLCSCSVWRHNTDQGCASALLKTVQFNNLIELGIKDSSIYEILDLKEFYGVSDSILAKNKWDTFIDDLRFFEGQKTTLRTNYIDYTCSCQKNKDTFYVSLEHKNISVSNFKIVHKDSIYLIVKRNHRRL